MDSKYFLTHEYFKNARQKRIWVLHTEFIYIEYKYIMIHSLNQFQRISHEIHYQFRLNFSKKKNQLYQQTQNTTEKSPHRLY